MKDQCKFHAVDSRGTEFQRFPLGWEQAHPPTQAMFSSLLEPESREQSTGHVRPRGAETLAVHPLSPYHVVRLSELQTRPSPHLLGALIISSFIHVGRHIPHVCQTYCHAGSGATLGRTVACFFAGAILKFCYFCLFLGKIPFGPCVPFVSWVQGFHSPAFEVGAR